MDTLTLRAEQDEIAVSRAEIAEIEVRLGTSFERPNDFIRCVELVHRIGNLLQVEGLRGEDGDLAGVILIRGIRRE